MPDSSEYENKPYKGHLSYQVEDGPIFFGRSREADQLVAKILALPFTLVHARSGAGKTSLLNARVIPGLEERGWTVVLARPHFDPSLSLREAALSQILPPPAAEARALARTKAELFPDREVALEEVLDRFDLLDVRDPRRRDLLWPLALRESTGKEEGSVRPLFFRLLRATLEIAQYGKHILALLGQEASEGKPALDSRVSVSALFDLLREPHLAKAHDGLVTSIMHDGPTLVKFAEQLVSRYGQRRTQFGLVLIMDQFEELFTRFTSEPGDNSSRYPSWKVRFDFFDELGELHAAMPRLPLHVVLSMRDEYIAQLDPLRRFVRELDAASYHLTFLERDEARACIREPARLFRYDYDEAVYADIFGALMREDRFIEPSQLQIVCEKLWMTAGRELAQSPARPSSEPVLMGIDKMPAGGARQILEGFFDEYLQELGAGDPSGASRLQALEILDSLVVAETGTRNVVEKKVLENAPFRDPKRRAELVESLAGKRIIRVEPRLGGEFAEITHEFLIASILQHIRVELYGDSDYANLSWALRALMRYRDVDFREGTGNLLPRSVFTILHRNRRNLFPGTSMIEQNFPELMLRSALALGAEPETVRWWLEEFRKSEVVVNLEDMLGEARRRDPSRRLMSLYELAVVSKEPPQSSLTAEQCAFVLNSLLERAYNENRDAIVLWTRLVKSHGTQPIPDH